MRFLVLALCLAFSSCSTFRGAVLDWNNSDLVGTQAPPLTGGTWAGAAPDVDGKWHLVAFLLPY